MLEASCMQPITIIGLNIPPQTQYYNLHQYPQFNPFVAPIPYVVRFFCNLNLNLNGFNDVIAPYIWSNFLVSHVIQ